MPSSLRRAQRRSTSVEIKLHRCQSLTIRMAIRRFTRLTNAFSKKLDNHEAACAVHFAYYNFCRVHSSLRVTPAMEAGLTNHVWTFGELIGVGI